MQQTGENYTFSSIAYLGPFVGLERLDVLFCCKEDIHYTHAAQCVWINGAQPISMTLTYGGALIEALKRLLRLLMCLTV